jgi:hypothetical protein
LLDQEREVVGVGNLQLARCEPGLESLLDRLLKLVPDDVVTLASDERSGGGQVVPAPSEQQVDNSLCSRDKLSALPKCSLHHGALTLAAARLVLVDHEDVDRNAEAPHLIEQTHRLFGRAVDLRLDDQEAQVAVGPGFAPRVRTEEDHARVRGRRAIRRPASSIVRLVDHEKS